MAFPWQDWLNWWFHLYNLILFERAKMNIWVVFLGCNAGGVFGVFSSEQEARESLIKNIKLIHPDWDHSSPEWNLGWPDPGERGFLNPDFFEWKLSTCVEIYLKLFEINNTVPQIVW